MDNTTEQAAQAAKASRGPDWRLDEKLSEGEIALPANLPIRMWIFTMQHVTQGVNFGIPWAESVQLDERFSLLFSPFTFLLKRSQSQSKAFLHGKDAFVLAHILAQIPPTEFQNLHHVSHEQ